jgi:hypothetical protein
MSSLLQEETTQTYWNRNQQVPHPQLHQKRVWPLTTEERRMQEVGEKLQLEELKEKEQYMRKLMQVEERSRQKRMEMEERHRKRQRRMITEERYQQGRIEKQDDDDVHQQEELDRSSGDDREGGTCNQLTLQGLTILERLASGHNNSLPESATVPSASVCAECKLSGTRYRSLSTECARQTVSPLGKVRLYRALFCIHSAH